MRRKKEEWGQCFVLSGSGGGGGVGLVAVCPDAGGKTGNAGSPLPPPGGTATNEDVPNSLYHPITCILKNNLYSLHNMLWDTYNMRQIEIIQKDLCDSHEHFGTLHPPVVAPDGHLEVKTKY